MSAIALDGNTLGCALGTGSFGGLGTAFMQAKKSTGELKNSLAALKQKVDLAALSVRTESSQDLGKKAETRENCKKSALTLAYEKLETFISDVGSVDEKAANKINQRKADFYTKYSYLKPDSEKSFKERAKDFGKDIWDRLCDIGSAIKDFVIDVGEWCVEHWKEILLTLVIVVGAIVAIVAVVATGGLALVPLLTGIITGAGALFGITVAASTAITIATVLSITVAVIAVGSTVLSSVMNIMDTWCDMSGNAKFKKWQKVMNITATISNVVYSIGNIYNSIKGVSGKEFITGNKSEIGTLAEYGDDFGKMGTYVKNPQVKVDWTQYAEHAAERMQQRGMTQEIINRIVENGKVLSQNNGSKFAYITKEGVAIVSKEGKLITAWSSADFDSSMLELIGKLFGK